MLAYIPYMDPMGMEFGWISVPQSGIDKVRHYVENNKWRAENVLIEPVTPSPAYDFANKKKCRINFDSLNTYIYIYIYTYLYIYICMYYIIYIYIYLQTLRNLPRFPPPDLEPWLVTTANSELTRERLWKPWVAMSRESGQRTLDQIETVHVLLEKHK